MNHYFLALIFLNALSFTDETSNSRFASIEVNIDGYTRNLGMSPTLYVQENGDWREVRSLDRRGIYIDDVYYPFFMTCIVECRRIELPIEVQLVGYDSIGVKSSPGKDDNQVPSYKTVQLHGKIRIDIPYSLDSTCIERKISSTVVYIP